MEQVESDAEARQGEGDADAEERPRPRQEQQQGVMDGGEEERRERQDEPEQRGGEPAVQGQRRQEERRCRLAHRHRLKTGNATWEQTGQRLIKRVSFTFFFFKSRHHTVRP